MDTAQITAMGAVLGVGATLGVALINARSTIRQLRSAKYLDLVTGERIARIRRLETDLSRLLTALSRYDADAVQPFGDAILQLCASLRTRLRKTPTVLHDIEEMVTKDMRMNTKQLGLELLLEVRGAIESEWDTVQMETGLRHRPSIGGGNFLERPW